MPGYNVTQHLLGRGGRKLIINHGFMGDLEVLKQYVEGITDFYGSADRQWLEYPHGVLTYGSFEAVFEDGDASEVDRPTTRDIAHARVIWAGLPRTDRQALLNAGVIIPTELL